MIIIITSKILPQVPILRDSNGPPKYNTNMTKYKNSHNTSISFNYRDATTTTVTKMTKPIDNTDTLTTEILTIREVILYAKIRNSTRSLLRVIHPPL